MVVSGRVKARCAAVVLVQVVQPALRDAATDLVESVVGKQQQLLKTLSSLTRCRSARQAMSREQLLNADGRLLTTRRAGEGDDRGDDDGGGSVWTEGAYVCLQAPPQRTLWRVWLPVVSVACGVPPQVRRRLRGQW